MTGIGEGFGGVRAWGVGTMRDHGKLDVFHLADALVAVYRATRGYFIELAARLDLLTHGEKEDLHVMQGRTAPARAALMRARRS